MSRAIIVTLLLLISFSVACIDLSQEDDPTPASATMTATPARETDAAATTPIATREATAVTPVQTLRIWAPPQVVGRTESGKTTFQAQLRAKALDYDNLDTKLEQKAVSGQGGILSYLRTGRNVAPSILPDLVALPTEQLETAVADGLIYPLDDLIDPEMLDDLYPAAQHLAERNEQLLGYPFALTELPHLVHNTQIISGTLPLTWSRLITADDNTIVLPASGRGGSTLGLQLYLEAGGELVNEAGQPALRIEPLTRALEQLNQAVAEGAILSLSGALATPEETWQSFQNGNSAIVQTTADHFLLHQDGETPLQAGPIPGLEERATPLVNGWAWAVSTPDPRQQALAVDFILALVETENLAEWSYRSRLLPARRSALALWPIDDPFLPFIREELELAQPYPILSGGAIGQALSNAVFDVVSQTKSPQEAAEEAVAALQS